MVKFGITDSDEESESSNPTQIKPTHIIDITRELSPYRRKIRNRTRTFRRPTPTYKIHTSPIQQPVIPNNTLAIGIYMHGQFVTDKEGNLIIINTPKNVHITKKNQGGGFGDTTFDYRGIDIHIFDTYPFQDGYFERETENYDYYRTFHNVLNNFERCVDKKIYNTFVESIIEKKEIPDNDLPLCMNKESCEIFDGVSQYYEKEFTTGNAKFPSIMLMIQLESDETVSSFGHRVRYINIVNCKEIELYNFFSQEGKPIRYYKKLNTFCKNFILKRNYYFYTSQIFDLINAAAEFLDVKKANILDETCNVIPSKGCTGPTCNNFKLGMVKDPDIGYGGKRKSKRKSKRLP